MATPTHLSDAASDSGVPALALLQSELDETRRRLAEAEQTLNAIRSGEVDAIIVDGAAGPQAYTLTTASEPYRQIVEQMLEAALTVTRDGLIVYCNAAFAAMIGRPRERLAGSLVAEFVAPADSRQLLAPGGNSGCDLTLVPLEGGAIDCHASSTELLIGGEHVFCCVVTNLTGQRLKARHDAIVQASSSAIYMLSPELVVETWNPAAVRLYGYAPGEIIGRPSEALCARGGFDEFQGLIARAGRNTSVSADIVQRHSDGAEFIVAVNLAAMRDAAGAINGFAVTSLDISERKRSETALRISNEMVAQQLAEIESIYASAQVGLGVLDRDLRYLRVNERLAEMNGVSVGDHIGRAVIEVVPKLAAIATEIAERIFRTGEGVTDIEISGETAAQPGVTRHWIEQWLPLRNAEGIVTGVNLVVEEVTQQKRDIAELQLAVERLRESEARFRAAVDAIDGIVWTANALGEVVGEQADWSSLTGQTPAESEGAGWAQAVHPDDAQPTLKAWNAAVAARAPYAFEHRLRRHDGQWRHFSVRAMPIFDAANNLLQWVGVHRDVTERHDREAHIQLLMNEVNHRSKNLLAVVMAVARQTSGDADQAAFIQRFSQRLQSLAAGQDLLVKNQWKGVLLADLVHAQLGPFNDLIGGRITVDGGAVHVSPAAAQTIGMALHELATNASKYGALSTDCGRVAITWQLVEGVAGARRLIMSWTESDGPPVVAPARRGFGSKVIDKMVRSSFDCEVTTDFAPSGFSWRLDCPAEKIIEANQPDDAADVEIEREIPHSGG